MKKFFSFLFVALFSMSMWGNSYWYAGAKQGSTWGADAMTVSADGFYEYIDGTYNGKHSFKIRLNNTDWTGALGNSYTASGYNGTNVTNMNSASSQWEQGENGNIQIQFNSNDTYYIIVYYPNTQKNPTNAPKVCASTILPNDETSNFYITGNAALLTGTSKAEWDPQAVTATGTSYTFEDLAAGYYELLVLPTGRWDDNVTRRYSQLTDKTDAGLTAGADDKICFRLTETANVTVTYSYADPENPVFTVTTDGTFFSITSGYYLVGVFGGVEKWNVTDLNSSKLFAAYDESQYKLSTTLAINDRIKVVSVVNNGISTWYPADGSGYTINSSSYAGAVNIYFKTTYQDSWSAFGGYFYIEQDSASDLGETVDGKKAVKRIVNGQLVIEREGKMYNALGAEVK